MSDLLFQQLSTVQSNLQPNPATIASAATISPQTKLTRITGTTPVTVIVPPVSGYCELTFVWSTGTSGAFATGGSGAGAIAVAKTTVTNVPVTLVYDPATTLWYAL
jgi:hypothetical protein